MTSPKKVIVEINGKKYPGIIAVIKPGNPIADKIFIDKQSAFTDFKFWTKHVKKDLKYIIKLDDDSRARRLSKDYDREYSRRNSSKINRYTDLLLNDLYHWYKSVHNSQFNKNVKKKIKANMDIDKEELVINVRNIRYHWYQTRQFFQQTKPSGRGKSVRWFMDKFPTENPFLTKSGKFTPILLASTIDPRVMLLEVEKIETIIKRNVKLGKDGHLKYYL